MNKNTLEQLTERFDVLPEDLKEAIRTFDYDHRLHQIHKKFKLHIDQSVALENAMADIVFGDLKSTDLMHRVAQELRIESDKASEIALALNSEIILPLRAHLQDIQSKRENAAKEDSTDSNLREVL